MNANAEGERSAALPAILIRRGDAPVAIGTSPGSEPISAETLLRQAAVIAALLPDNTPGSEVAFSFEGDQLGCAAALLATWAKGHVAALPENGARENIMPLLAHAENVAFLHDTGVGLGFHVPTVLAEAELGAPLAWEPIEDDRVVLSAFLQPPLGEAASASWAWAELLADLDRFADHMGLTTGSVIASALSPTALPGLLLGLLAPLRRGAMFTAATVSPTAPLHRETRALIVTPAHARAWSKLPPDGMAQIDTIYHVDADLDPGTRAVLSERGVRAEAVPPLPLDEVPPAFLASLRIALIDAGQGHADQGGVEHVSDAAVALLPSPDGTPTRALVVVAGPETAGPLLDAIIAEHLPDNCAHEWRVVPRLPRDANGRLSDWRIFLMFRYGRNGSRLEPELSWTEVEEEDPVRRRFRTQLPDNYAFFEGHYTTYPVLAGAAQLHELALPCVRRLDRNATELRRLSALKFLARIAPGDEIDVVVRRGEKPLDFRYEILCGETRCSVGRLEFFGDGEGQPS